jgi:hypothetical protein
VNRFVPGRHAVMWLGVAGFPVCRSGSMRIGMIDMQAIRKRWDTVGSKLDERGQRVFASGEVRAAGWVV